MLVFPNITTETCPTPANGAGNCADPRCSDPTFAAANPELCAGAGIVTLVITPESALICQNTPLQFEAFLSANGSQVQLTAGVIFASSNGQVLGINATTGAATGLGAGIVTVSASWQGQTAFAQITVLGIGCCDTVPVAMLVVVDNSLSMSLVFDNVNGTKLDVAKALAYRFVTELNTVKDEDAVNAFNVVLIDGQTPPFQNNITSLQELVNAINQSNALTDLSLLLSQLQWLNQQQPPEGRLALVLFSDGQNTVGTDLTALLAAAMNFKSVGNIIMVIGIRAYGDGFAFLNQLASGGFFLNATPETVDSFQIVSDEMSGLKGFFCAGACGLTGYYGYGYGCLGVPPGAQLPDPQPQQDPEVPGAPEFSSTKTVCVSCPGGTNPQGQGKFDYTGFANWDVIAGCVDLKGNGFEDTAPPQQVPPTGIPNGMYVDLSGTHCWPPLGTIRTKNAFTFVAGKTYQLSFYLTGNLQAQDPGNNPWIVETWLESAPGVKFFDQFINVTQWNQPFTKYSFTFTPGNKTGKLVFRQAQTGPFNNIFGNFLDYITLQNVTDNTQVFFEDFDGENAPAQVCRTATETSNVSQEDADNKATAAARLAALAALNCK